MAPAADPARPAHQQRHARHLAVERPPVLEPTVLAELLAVVGDEHDQRRPVEPEDSEAGQELAEALVEHGHVAVVEPGERRDDLGRGQLGPCEEPPERHVGVDLRRGLRRDEACRHLGRRPVGRVRVARVEVEEEGAAPMRVEPREGHGVELRRRGVHGVALVALGEVLVGAETAVEAEAGGDVQVGDDGAGRVTRGVQRLGERRHVRAERAHERGGAVLVRPATGQDARRRGARP
jgi:hypothetical protein